MTKRHQFRGKRKRNPFWLIRILLVATMSCVLLSWYISRPHESSRLDPPDLSPEASVNLNSRIQAACPTALVRPVSRAALAGPVYYGTVTTFDQHESAGGGAVTFEVAEDSSSVNDGSPSPDDPSLVGLNPLKPLVSTAEPDPVSSAAPIDRPPRLRDESSFDHLPDIVPLFVLQSVSDYTPRKGRDTNLSLVEVTTPTIGLASLVHAPQVANYSSPYDLSMGSMQLQDVPEPSATLLILSGFGLGALVRRWKHR